MSPFSPIVVAVLIIGTVAVIGILVNASRRDSTLSGFEGLAGDLEAIRRRVRGHLYRETSDIVIDGDLKGQPITLRFSHRDDMPGVHIHLAAPSTFTLYIASPQSTPPKGLASVRIPEAQLELRFATWSSTPAEARLFAGIKGAREALRSLCVWGSTSISIQRGSIEVAELALPQHLAERTLKVIASLGDLAAAMTKMPHADLVKVVTVRRNYSVLARTAMVAGIVTAVGAVASASYESERKPVQASERHIPAGINTQDVALIAGLEQWQLAEQDDFEGGAVRWFREHNQQLSGKVDLDLTGSGSTTDVAYTLIRAEHGERVVLIEKGELKYDASYPAIAAVIRVPASALSQVTWAAEPLSKPDGDGLLVVFRTNDHDSGIVLYSHAGRISSAAPADYQQIAFQ